MFTQDPDPTTTTPTPYVPPTGTYNTTPDWPDPNTVPPTSFRGYAAWLAANPNYQPGTSPNPPAQTGAGPANPGGQTVGSAPPPAAPPAGPTGPSGPSGPSPISLSPFTEPFTNPTPTPMPDAPTFTAPSLQDAENTPGYQFAAQQGEQALQQSQAAQGLGATGGSLKDILSWGDNYAAQNYQQAFNNAVTAFQPQLTEWQTNSANVQSQNQFNSTQAFNQWLQDYNIFNGDRNFNWQAVSGLYGSS